MLSVRSSLLVLSPPLLVFFRHAAAHHACSLRKKENTEATTLFTRPLWGLARAVKFAKRKLIRFMKRAGRAASERASERAINVPEKAERAAKISQSEANYESKIRRAGVSKKATLIKARGPL